MALLDSRLQDETALESRSESSASSSQTVSITDRLGLRHSFKRRSYTREDKLHVLKFHKDNDRNLYKTCQQFNLNTKHVLRWIKEEKIREQERSKVR